MLAQDTYDVVFMAQRLYKEYETWAFQVGLLKPG